MGVTEQMIEPRQVPEARLVTAKSFLIDRIEPQCEVVCLPGITLRAGTLRLESGRVRLVPKKRRRLSALIPPSDEKVPKGAWAFDMRQEDPANWAHFLNDHLPLFFHAAHITGRDPEAALLLLPSDIPDYIPGAAAMFGLTCRATDAVVEGEGVAVDLTPFIANRTVRNEWVAHEYPQAVLEHILAEPPSTDLPKKVFLTRRDRRALSNQAEIETYLAGRGYRPVLPEALPVADQFRLFLGAEEMVAVSGASLAPLLYTRAGARGPARVIELQPCGHMSSVYREMAHQVGTRFAGVRGRIKPEYVKPAYDFATPFRKFSQDNFHVDPDSLEKAFGILG